MCETMPCRPAQANVRRARSASAGYGFITFSNHSVAESVLTTYNGVPIPNTDLVFRLNWAAFGVGKITSEGAPSRPGRVGDRQSPQP